MFAHFELVKQKKKKQKGKRNCCDKYLKQEIAYNDIKANRFILRQEWISMALIFEIDIWILLVKY